MLDSVETNVKSAPWYREAAAHNRHPKTTRVIAHLERCRIRKARQEAECGLARYHCLVDDRNGDLTELTPEQLTRECGLLDGEKKPHERQRLTTAWVGALVDAAIIMIDDGVIYPLESGGKLHLSPEHYQIRLLPGKTPEDDTPPDASNSNNGGVKQIALPASPTPLKNPEESRSVGIPDANKRPRGQSASNPASLPCKGVDGVISLPTDPEGSCWTFHDRRYPACSRCMAKAVRERRVMAAASRYQGPPRRARQNAKPCEGSRGKQSAQCEGWRHKIPDGAPGAGQYFEACRQCRLEGKDREGTPVVDKEPDTGKGQVPGPRRGRSPLHCLVCGGLKRRAGDDYCDDHGPGDMPTPPPEQPPLFKIGDTGLPLPDNAHEAYMRGMASDRTETLEAVAQALRRDSNERQVRHVGGEAVAEVDSDVRAASGERTA